MKRRNSRERDAADARTEVEARRERLLAELREHEAAGRQPEVPSTPDGEPPEPPAAESEAGPAAESAAGPPAEADPGDAEEHVTG